MSPLKPSTRSPFPDRGASFTASTGGMAGGRKVALTTTHPVEQLGEANLVVPDLTHIVIDLAGSGFRVHAATRGRSE